ncbi:MAG: hypothetical protein LAT66_06185 [Alkalimonas sp.]|nr:hypothetical protein [Alkalimonas sp.]
MNALPQSELPANNSNPEQDLYLQPRIHFGEAPCLLAGNKPFAERPELEPTAVLGYN